MTPHDGFWVAYLSSAYGFVPSVRSDRDLVQNAHLSNVRDIHRNQYSGTTMRPRDIPAVFVQTVAARSASTSGRSSLARQTMAMLFCCSCAVADEYNNLRRLIIAIAAVHIHTSAGTRVCLRCRRRS